MLTRIWRFRQRMPLRQNLTAAPARQEAGMCFLTEKEPVWAGMLADVLAQTGIPLFSKRVFREARRYRPWAIIASAIFLKAAMSFPAIRS